jgi:hypothetical protein
VFLESKVQYGRAFPGIFARNAAQVLGFVVEIIFAISKLRHSGAGRNPILRMLNTWNGLGPGLRWGDGAL